MTATKSRYRPAFSEEEVEALATILLEAYLADIAKPPYNPSRPADSKRAFSSRMKLVHYRLMGKINTLRTKIANNALSPAYVVRKHIDPAIAILEDLGAPEDEIAAATGGETKEQYWEACYIQFQKNPNLCTVPQIEAAHEHMYLHDLMTPEEVAAFEFNAEQKGTI